MTLANCLLVRWIPVYNNSILCRFPCINYTVHHFCPRKSTYLATARLPFSSCSQIHIYGAERVSSSLTLFLSFMARMNASLQRPDHDVRPLALHVFPL